jgi:2-oxoglutarate dehydrogenase E1 component
MGAWRFLLAQFGSRLFGRHPFAGITRPASASPATGSASMHKKEQAEVVQNAFA